MRKVPFQSEFHISIWRLHCVSYPPAHYTILSTCRLHTGPQWGLEWPRSRRHMGGWVALLLMLQARIILLLLPVLLLLPHHQPLQVGELPALTSTRGADIPRNGSGRLLPARDYVLGREHL
jgi:hypothetical protein